MADTPMFPLPVGAEKFSHVTIEEHIAEQDFFTYRSKYPSTAALEHYVALLKGWTVCRGQSDEWTAYGDQANGANEYLHLYSRFFLSPKRDEAVLVFLRYKSPGLVQREVPTTDEQFVGVIRYRPREMDQFLSMQPERCE
jgi:hypothetical protein